MKRGGLCYASVLHLRAPDRILSQIVTEHCRFGNGVGGLTSIADAPCFFDNKIKTSPFLYDENDEKRDPVLDYLISLTKRLEQHTPILEQHTSTSSSSLSCFRWSKRVDLGLSALGVILKLGLPINVVAPTALGTGKMDDQTLRFLDDTRGEGSGFAIIAKGLCRVGNTRLALELLRDWEEETSCWISSSAYNVIMDGLCKEGMIAEALRLHGSMCKKGLKPNVVAYDALVRGLENVGRCKDAILLFEKIAEVGIKVHNVTCDLVIRWMCNSGQLKEARRLISCMVQNNIAPSVGIFDILVDRHCKERMFEEAEDIIDEMNQLERLPSSFAYNTLLYAYCSHGRIIESKELEHLMMCEGCSPDSVTLDFTVKGYCKAKRDGMSKTHLQEMIQKGLIPPDATTYNILLREFGRVANLEAGEELINEMQSRDLTLNPYALETFLDASCNQEGHDTASKDGRYQNQP